MRHVQFGDGRLRLQFASLQFQFACVHRQQQLARLHFVTRLHVRRLQHPSKGAPKCCNRVGTTWQGMEIR